MVSSGGFSTCFGAFLADGGRPTAVTTLAKSGPLGENLNKNSYLMRKLAPLAQLARLMSSRIVLAAQMNSNAPSVVVTAADSSE